MLLSCIAACSTPLDPGRSDAGTEAGPEVPPQPTVLLRFVPTDTLQLRPSQTVTVRVEVSDPAGNPIEGLPLRFSLIGDSADATLVDTRAVSQFSADRRTTYGDVTLHASSVSSDFSLRVMSADGAAASRTVSVSDQGFGSIVASFSYDGVRGATQFDLSLFSDARCEAIANARAIRAERVTNQNAARVRFDSLAAGRAFALLAEGFGEGGERVATGCVEGVLVARDSTREIPVQLRDFPLRSEGRYALDLQLGLDVVAGAAASLWRESTRINNDEAGALLYAMSAAVEQSSGVDARVQFDAAIEAQLRRDVENSLRTRDSLPSALIARWAQAIAATVGGAYWHGEIMASIRDGRTEFSVDRVTVTVDPQTPDNLADDLTRELPAAGAGRIEALAADRMSITFSRVAMPVSAMALAARDAQLARVHLDTTAARLRSSVRCDLLEPIARPFAARCDRTCLVNACEAVLAQWGDNFDQALTGATQSLQTIRGSFVGVARAPAGSVTVSRVASGAVEGSFEEDPSRPVRGVGTLSRP